MNIKREKIQRLRRTMSDAYKRSSDWLARANELIEAGAPKHKIDEAERKATFWLIRYTNANERMSDLGADIQEGYYKRAAAQDGGGDSDVL